MLKPVVNISVMPAQNALDVLGHQLTDLSKKGASILVQDIQEDLEEPLRQLFKSSQG
jgi:hypothetical protein